MGLVPTKAPGGFLHLPNNHPATTGHHLPESHSSTTYRHHLMRGRTHRHPAVILRLHNLVSPNPPPVTPTPNSSV